ncbi:DUF1476 domain-containing protein [Geminicoccus flavidas]|uniref:DUF1476 domain-containing protein n=1 Tax=Geminicoccus flavidas TaxID=2506407 RepID=UPI00190FA8BA|nr:DUF1476 domain-containing protein [Geminicoccus flavidas]
MILLAESAVLPPAALALGRVAPYIWCPGTMKPAGATMTTFDDRERSEEARFRHDQEIYFKVRNRRNKLLGLKIANDYLDLHGDEAAAYAKDVVMADFERPGDDDVVQKVRADVAAAGKSISDHMIEKYLQQFEASARASVKAE